jgi:uncharacterized protein (DUF1499 family)
MNSEQSTQANRRSRTQWFIRRVSLVLILTLGALFGLSMTSSQPENLGVTNGRLAKCPDSPNCVSTQASDESHQMPAITLSGTKEEIIAKIKSVIKSDFPRARLIEETDNYLHYEFTSLVFRFVDDVEFLVDDASEVNFRSASRVGRSDLGANRKRMGKISERLKQ